MLRYAYTACLLTKTGSVYCAVRTEYLNTSQVCFSIVGRAVGPRLLIAEAGGSIPGQSILGLWWTKLYWDRFSVSTAAFRCQCISSYAPHSYAPYYCFYQKNKLANPEIFPTNRCDLGYREFPRSGPFTFRISTVTYT